MLHFAADIAEDLSYAHVDVRFAIVFFERRQPYKYDFKEIRDLTSVIRTIMRLPYAGSRGSFLHRALRMINDQDMFGGEAGSRHDAEKVVIVMTDGRWKNERQTLFEAEELKRHDVIFVSVAVGHHPEMNELKCLASCPRYVFNVDCFDLLLVFKIDLMRITCKDVPITSDLVSRAVPTESSGPIYVSTTQHEVFTSVHEVSQDFSTESNTEHIQSQSFRTDLTIASSHAVVTTTQIALQTLNTKQLFESSTEPLIQFSKVPSLSTEPLRKSSTIPHLTTALESTESPQNLTTKPALKPTKIPDLTTEPAIESTKIPTLTSESPRNSTKALDLTTEPSIESTKILDVTTKPAIESTKIQDLTTELSLQSTKFKDLTTEPSLLSTKFKDLTTEPSLQSTKFKDFTTESSVQSTKFKDLTTEPSMHSTKIPNLTSESVKDSSILPDLTTKHAIESSRIPDLTTEPAKVFTKTPELTPEPVLKSTKLSELTNQPVMESNNILDLTTKPSLQSTQFKDLITEPAIHSTKIQDLTSAKDSTILPDVTTKHAIESSKILVLTSEPAKNASTLSDSITEPPIESTQFQESTSEPPTKPSKLPDLTSETALESTKIPNLTSEPARTSTKLPDLTTVTPKIIDLTTEHAIESTKLHNVTTKPAIESTKILALTTEHSIESTRKLSFTTEPALDSTKSPDSTTESAFDSTKSPDFTTEPAIESTKLTDITTELSIESTKLTNVTTKHVIESTKLPAIESSKLPDVTSEPTIESSMLPVVKTEAAKESSKLPGITTKIFMESKSLVMNSKSSLELLSSDESIIPSIDSTSTLDVNTKTSEETTSIVDPKTKPYLESSTVILSSVLSKESALTFDSSTKSAKETSTFLESTKLDIESTTSKKTLFYVSTETDLESSLHFDHSSKHFIDLTPSSDVGSISDFKSSSTSDQSTELSKGFTPTFHVITESDMSSYVRTEHYIESSLSSDVTKEFNTELTPSVKETIGSLLNSNTESTPLLDLTIGPTIESLPPLHISTRLFMKSTQMIDLNTQHVKESTQAFDLSIEPATQYSTLIILSSNPSGESTLSQDLSTKPALKSTRSLNLSTEPANSTQTLDLSTESGLKSIQSFDVSTKPVMESTQSLDLSTEPVLKSIQSLDVSTEPAKSTHSLDLSTEPVFKSTQSLDLSTEPAKSTQSLDLSTEPAKSTQSLDLSTEPAKSTQSLDLSTEPTKSTQSLDLSTEPAKSTQSLDLSTEPAKPTQSPDLSTELAKSTQSLDLSTEPAKPTQSLDLSTEPAKSTQSLDLSTEPAKPTQSLDLSTEPAKSTQSLDLSTEPAKSTQSLDLSTEPAKSTQSLDLSTESAFNAFKSTQSLDLSTEPVLQSTQSIDLSTEPVVDTTSEYPYRFTSSIFSSWHLHDVSVSPSLLSHDDQAQTTLHISLPSSLIKPGISPVSLPSSALATPPPPSQPCPQHAQLDIMLVLEASPGTGSRNWVSLIKFVIDLIYSFNIGPDDVKFGAIFSSQEPVKQCDFNTYQTVSSLLKAILSIQFPSRPETNTYKALQLITQDRMFSVEAGGRVSAKDVVIVITDGNSTFPMETQNAADDLKKNGVTIYTVGVGPYVNEKLLQDVASSPGQFIKSESFGSLDINRLKILEVACSNHSSSITVPTLLTTSELSAVQFSWSTEAISWSTEAISSTTTMPHESTSGITVTPSPTIPQCPDFLQLDIILVLDASSSIIRDKDWNYLTQAVGQLISSLPIGPRNIRFGIVYFNRRVTKVCDLKTYDSKEGLYNAVTQIKYPYVAGTHTHRALDQIINDDMFSSKSGGREEAKDVVIVVTDGWSNFPGKTLNSARELKISGVTVISVGVGTGINMAEIQGIASGPDDVILASNFQSLEAVYRDLIGILCRDMMSTIDAVASSPTLLQSSFMDIVFTQPISITTSISSKLKSSEGSGSAASTLIPTVHVCPDTVEADIILVLDASLSIGAKNWPFLTKVAGEITSRFTISQEKVRFGAIFFNRKPTKLFDLKTYNNNRDIYDALVSIKYPHLSGTHTDKALDLITTDQMFSSQSGGRDSAKDLVIVITDGYSYYPEKTQESAADLKKQGITVISVGFGPDVSMTELEGMSSGPGLVYLASDFQCLQDIQTQLIQKLCQIMSSSTMLPSPYLTCTAQNTLPTAMSTHPSMVYACRDLTCSSDLKEINTPATALVQTELTPYKTEMTSTKPIQPSWSSESTVLEKTTKLVHTTNGLSRSLQHPTESFSHDLVKQSASSSPTSFAFHNTLQPSWTSEITIKHESSESLSGASIISKTSAFIPSCSDSVQLDIVLVLDASSSIGLKNWTYLTQTAGNIITRFPVGVRFAVITFNVRANKIFDLNTYITSSDVYNAVIKIPYVHISGTHTHRALEMVITDQMFSRERGGRDEAYDVVIVITDGRSNFPNKTYEAASELKKLGITIMSVGVGKEISMTELQGMASSPNLVILAKDYPSLDVIKSKLIQRVCEIPEHMNSTVSVGLMTKITALQREETSGNLLAVP
ncbi:collagen alpha-6(VI) chain [Biomphalaria glabrata]|nr:collagen alpha-6(VI) chain [Biomphalaria glabrata]